MTETQTTATRATIETSLGTIEVALWPDKAPGHVTNFKELADAGFYDELKFHRVIPDFMVQTGCPNGTGMGGPGWSVNAEFNDVSFTKGTLGMARASDPDSAGSQFFVCVTDQPALDGTYTVFGRVSEGMLVVQKISEAAADENGLVRDRIEIRRVTIRETPPPEPDPFSTGTAEDLSVFRATLETSMGEIGLEFFPDKAPEHVRNFLRLAGAGVYDGMAIHRVARGFVLQTGFLPTRAEPLTERQQRVVRTLSPEFNDIHHTRGTISMARGADPASASTSFFVVTADQPGLDGQYTAFGRVASGLDVVERIEAVEVDGETPRARIDLRRVRVERRP